MDDFVAQLRRAALRPRNEAKGDGELLDEYVRRRDEVAFEALLLRHGPMVWGVCRRVLGNQADAEDAFQATFLVLVRKADSVVPRSRLGNWLYGVAHKTALKARQSSRNRRAREQSAAEGRRPEPSNQDDSLRELLDEEVLRLPEKYRVPVVLCDLQGRTLKDVAQHLGWPQGTVAGRLARARGLLAQRLARRGLALSATALVAALSQSSASASVPALVVTSTVRAALAFAADPAAVGAVSAPVAALAEGVLKAMTWAKLKKTAALMTAVTILLGALGGLTLSAPAGRGPVIPVAQKEEKPREVSWKQRHEVEMERGTQIFAATISGDGKVVAYATNKGVRLFDAVKGKELALVDLDVTLACAISPDGKKLATGHAKSIKLWDVATGKGLATLADDTRNVARVVFSPDGKLLASAEAGALRTWDLSTNKEVRKFVAAEDEKRVVYAAAFSPDGKTLASAEGPASTVKLWAVATGKEVRTIEGHEKGVIDVAFSADGKVVASAGGDGRVKLWDASTGKEKTSLKWQTGGRHSLAFSPDGKWLATAGGQSESVMIWDAKTGKDLATLEHKGTVRSVAFSRDGKTLVTGGDDALRLWQAEEK